MADIIQLVENGQKKYLKTHIQAIEGIDLISTETTIFNGAVYFSDTDVFRWDSTKKVKQLTLVFSRYKAGEGPEEVAYFSVSHTRTELEGIQAKNFFANSVKTDGSGIMKAYQFGNGFVKGDAFNSTNVDSKTLVLRKVIVEYLMGA